MTCAERVGREVLHTSKKEKQEMACAEPPLPSGATPKREPAHATPKNPTTIIKNKTSGNFFQPHSILLL